MIGDQFNAAFIGSHWREMAALALSVLRGIVENVLEMEKVYVYLPQVNCAFSNIFASILLRSPISRQRLSSFSSARARVVGGYCIAELVTLFPKGMATKLPKDIRALFSIEYGYKLKDSGLVKYAKFMKGLTKDDEQGLNCRLDRIAARIFPDQPTRYENSPLNMKLANLLTFCPSQLIFPTHRAQVYPPGVVS